MTIFWEIVMLFSLFEREKKCEKCNFFFRSYKKRILFDTIYKI